MKKTIQKVLAELKTEHPDLSYIRGLLEGLVEEEVEVRSGFAQINPIITQPPSTMPGTIYSSTDPSILDPNNPLSSKWNPPIVDQMNEELKKLDV